MAILDEILLQPESLASIMEQADRAEFMMEAVRGKLLAPDSKKESPRFNATQLAALCDVDRNAISYRLTKDDHLPKGQINESGNGVSSALPRFTPGCASTERNSSSLPAPMLYALRLPTSRVASVKPRPR
jgi:hypothetical protein